MEQGWNYFKLGGTEDLVSLWSVACARGEAVVGGTPGAQLSALIWPPKGHAGVVPFLHPEGLLDSPQAKWAGKVGPEVLA